MYRCIFFLIGILPIALINAQPKQGYNYTRYTVKNGLAANHVKSLTEDCNGFMWLSTFNAVQWFDGVHFHSIQQGNGIHQLPNINKVDIYSLSDKKILFVYTNGFSVYQPQTHNFNHYILQSNKINPVFLKDSGNVFYFLNGTDFQEYNIDEKKVITSINLKGKVQNSFYIVSTEQKNDLILLTDKTGNDVIINTKDKSVKKFSSPTASSLSYSSSNFYNTNNYISFTENGIIKRDNKTGSIISSVNFSSQPKTEIYSVIHNEKLSPNIFVVAVGKKLLVYNAETNTIVNEITTTQDETILQTGYVEVIYIDSHKNIWLCSNAQGVYKINYLPNSFKYFMPTNDATDFSIEVEANKEDNVVISGSYGKGIFIYDTSGNFKKQIPIIDKQHPELTIVTSIQRIAPYEYILICYGAMNTIYKLNTKNYSITSLKIFNEETQKQILSVNGSYYQKLIRAGIDSFYYQLTNGNLFLLKIEKHRVVAISTNAKKLIPFVKYKTTIAGVVEPGGLGIFNNNSLKIYNVFPKNISINSMAVTSDGSYWVATSAGVYKISGEGKFLAKFTTHAGLANDNIFSIAADANNNIWCGHYKGISKITSGGSITNFSEEDGLQNNEFNTNAVYKAKDGELFFGGENGINSFYPQLLLSKNETLALKVVELKAGKYFDKIDTAFWNINELKLNYNNNVIQFVFNAIGKQQPTAYNYQYRLRNNYTSWINLQQNNNILLTLQPGEYYLDLYASNFFDKNAQPLKTIKIIITPPFWKTEIFIVACILLLVAVLIYFIQYFNKIKYRKQLQELKLQQQLEEERKRISRDMHDTMGAYTSALLSNVQQLKKTQSVNEQELNKMQNNAEQILNSLRETIWVLNNQSITVNDFSDSFKNYCIKLLQNFEDINFDVKESITVNKTISAQTAIHLNKIMQEAIQNIIKHAQATSINYSINCNGKIIIVIADNGKGFNVENICKGNGIENMQWRAANAAFNFTIQSTQSGTSVTITEK
ncbi:MAG: hypothetical protein JSR09_07245 [Bacteroidetes bacterium]|nr:hypothetical protein [Bacteroidota bacterium]MBS1649489.1 hypothetical protein [Bacteroidota bacterium]